MGHFGRALPRYTHFTSPIRRYADLVVHRGLIRALGFGGDGLTDEQMDKLSNIGEQISSTERRAMAAERESTDRYLANYLSDHVGDEFMGRITGVTRFGLFVSLEPSGGDGLIPISEIGMDFYSLDEAHHRLVGESSGEEFKLGDRIKVRLTEANRFTGGLKLNLVRENDDIPGLTSRKQHKKLGARHARTGGRPARTPRGGRGKTAGKKAKPKGR